MKRLSVILVLITFIFLSACESEPAKTATGENAIKQMEEKEVKPEPVVEQPEKKKPVIYTQYVHQKSNVYEGYNLNSKIVKTIEPNSAIEVSKHNREWRYVYDKNGQRIGFIQSGLLKHKPIRKLEVGGVYFTKNTGSYWFALTDGSCDPVIYEKMDEVLRTQDNDAINKMKALNLIARGLQGGLKAEIMKISSSGGVCLRPTGTSDYLYVRGRALDRNK